MLRTFRKCPSYNRKKNICLTGPMKNIVFLSQKIDDVAANSVDPDEMPHYAVFHPGLHCLSKFPFTSFWSIKKFPEPHREKS